MTAGFDAASVGSSITGGGCIGRVPLHFGYAVQPQNTLPGFAPRLAVRFTISPLHAGQVGDNGSLGGTTLTWRSATVGSVLGGVVGRWI